MNWTTKRQIPLPKIDVDALLHAVISENEKELNDIISPFSSWENNLLSGISFLKHGIDQYERLLGMQLLAAQFRNQGDLITATAVALRIFQFLETILERKDNLPEATILMAGNNLDVVLSGMTEIGNPREIVKEAERWIKLFVKLDKPYFVARVKLKQVEALILGGHYEEAKKILDEIEKSDLHLTADQRFEKNRLRRKIPDLLRAVDEAEREQPDFEKIVTHEVFPALSDLLSKDDKRIENAIKTVRSSRDNTIIAETVEMLGYPYGYITVKNLDELSVSVDCLFEAGNPNGALMGILQGASEILQNEQTGNDKNTLMRLVNILEKANLYAQELEFWEYVIQSGWLRAIAWNRMRDFPNTITSLRKLRDEIDLRRLSIKNPRLRAGLIVYLPHLYEVSTETLYKAGTEFKEELFHVIEGAKSKILGDLIRSRHIHPDTPLPHESANFRTYEKSILSNLRTLLTQSQTPAHYLTFLVGHEHTYAILVDCNGVLHSKRITIKRNSIIDAVAELTNLNTGKGADHPALRIKINHKFPWETPYDPIIKKLSPLVEWLDEFVDKDIIQKNHIICYSPDGLLFNIPFQMLQMNDEPLISLVGLTCVPSAEVLLQCEKFHRKYVRKEHVCAVLVPLSKDNKHDYDKEIRWIESQKIPTTSLLGPKADYETIRKTLKEGMIVHFAAHGIFNVDDPLGRSGLSIGHDRDPRTGSGKRREDYLITPNLMEKLNLVGSHVTLRACVSGEVTEITAREALGMLWAIFQAGTVSAIVAAWSPALKSASTLLLHFYQYWLGQQMPRWQAHQLAMRTVMKTDYASSHPYHWSAFLLYGYWE